MMGFRLPFIVCHVVVVALSFNLNVTDWLDSYEIVTPLFIEDRTVNKTRELTYAIMIDSKDYIIHLVHNPMLVTTDFKVFSYSKTYSLYFDEPHILTHCYYQGYVQGYPNSVVAMNTCSGLRGIMHTDEFIYAIEPSEPLHHFEHIAYSMEQFKTTIDCLLDTSIYLRSTESSAIEQGLCVRNKTAYVEVFMVATQQQFEFHHENRTFLLESMLDLINSVNAVYQDLNTHIILVGIEIWSNDNLINTEGRNVHDILSDFLAWKKEYLDEHIKCAVAVLSLRDETIPSSGLSHLRGACSLDDSAFMIMMNLEKPMLSLDLFVHELGHILGMRHDTSGCKCKSGKPACVMASRGLLSLGFSDCNEKDMEMFFASSEASCLWKELSQCGNNILEQGEKCDCGSVQECPTISCCDPTSCKLRENGECLTGLCCKDCKLLPKGTLCRMPKTECDLAEYCDGASNHCPLDMYKQNGAACNNGTSVCYENRCYDYNKHCESIFGEGATVAPFSCFQWVNTIGDRFGNCNTEREMVECNIKNVMCGRLQCQNVSSEMKPVDSKTAIILTPNGNSWCWGLDFHSKHSSFDLGSVPDGAPCDTGKICLNKRCVSSSLLSYDCDAEHKCGGNGVCNNRKNCHFYSQWAPPNCTQSGYGGSVDSGPITKHSPVEFMPEGGILRLYDTNAASLMVPFLMTTLYHTLVIECFQSIYLYTVW
ncbi:ADAM metallopeptidase domain 21 L homeolog precursor [Xenopus laevis]|uniref:ADAM metallopeptidase domain 21 L homeolog precursor n=1 Tax=Xenopus laevis TaxID=8355 RepID=O42593_XENLA|nr:ADAM metallopeptidase domain 21 L homeolog precursor [Xenopus laevis]AAB62001.1 membrane anchored metalloprotease; disintegrin; cysteine-rich protein [Xenopus laevis]